MPMLDCRDCELCKTRIQVVPGKGPMNTGLTLVGEAPGKDEDLTGRPFAGKAGRELDGQYLLRFARVLRDEWYVTNVVKCHPPGNRDPKPEEIRACSRHLNAELDTVRPTIIGTLGKFATQHILGQAVDMEMIHGIPQRGMNDVIVVPCYHPAAGLHDPSKMVYIQRDFEMLGKVVRGEVVPEQYRDEIEQPWYHMPFLDTTNLFGCEMKPGTFMDVLSVDTETDCDGRLFSVQFCDRPGTAEFFSTTPQKYEWNPVTVINSALLLMHNALFDLPLLRSRFSAIQSTVMDTMVMAYVLQDEPQGLKALAYRHCGMKMQSYEDLVRPAQQVRSSLYLKRIRQNTWPKPEQVLVWDGDNPRLKKPWPIERKAMSILKSAAKDPSVDMYDRWNSIPPEEGRGMAEGRCGPMPKAGIESVKLSDAVYYACRDADATMRIYPKLWSRIKEYRLEQAFWIDMGIVDMVIDMMHHGMPTQPEKFRQLAEVFGRHADEIERDITQLVGRYVNPGSSQQVAELLFKTLGIRSRKKSKKSGNDSTDQKYLEQMKDEHPVVEKILSWRKYRKLKSTYAESLPRMVDSGGRIHPRIKTTRTSTGRLATADPNLQNIPVRTAEGRMIRECFVASPGCVFLGLDYCLAGNTEVITELGKMPISDVYPGLGILSSDGHAVRFNRITRKAELYVSSVVRVTTDCGEVVCTGDHKWMLKNGDMVTASCLSKGDRLCHVKDGYSGRYPTWYIHTHTNYVKKHIAAARYRYGAPPAGYETDHIDWDTENWTSVNLRYIPVPENRAQGGQRYWAEVKAGDRTDSARLQQLKEGLKKRRSYAGNGNPQYGKKRGRLVVCPVCGMNTYVYPSQKKTLCSRKCYKDSLKNNHKVLKVETESYVGNVYHITVENDHTFVLANGMVSGNSQIELRTLAHESQDPVMLEAYRNDEDIHSKTASLVFGIPMDRLHPYNHRRPAKTCNFAVVYGITPPGLQDSLAREGADPKVWTLDRCEEFISEWFRIYSGVKDYMARQEQHARMYGYVKDMFGRLRWIPGVYSTLEPVVSGGVREAGNMPIQAGAQEIMKISMADMMPMCRTWQAERRNVKPVMQIHDELLWEVEERMVKEVYTVCKITMENAVRLSVPVKVDGKVGPVWGAMKDMKI